MGAETCANAAARAKPLFSFYGREKGKGEEREDVRETSSSDCDVCFLGANGGGEVGSEEGCELAGLRERGSIGEGRPYTPSKRELEVIFGGGS